MIAFYRKALSQFWARCHLMVPYGFGVFFGANKNIVLWGLEDFNVIFIIYFNVNLLKIFQSICKILKSLESKIIRFITYKEPFGSLIMERDCICNERSAEVQAWLSSLIHSSEKSSKPSILRALIPEISKSDQFIGVKLESIYCSTVSGK